jgi:hypothetical protein
MHSYDRFMPARAYASDWGGSHSRWQRKKAKKQD